MDAKIKELYRNYNYVNGKSHEVFMPNEIFNDLSLINLSLQEQAVAYAYYFLSCYNYANCVVANCSNSSIHESVPTLKLLVATYAKINPIVKKGGVLESLSYIKQENNYPIHPVFDDDNKEVILDFYTYRDLLKDMPEFPKEDRLKPRTTYPKPLKFFKRTIDSNYYNGHFFDPANTHKALFSVFAKCITNRKVLGCKLFYIYNYLLRLQQKLHAINPNKSFNLKYLEAITPFKSKAISRYLKTLEDQNLIKRNYSSKTQFTIMPIMTGNKKQKNIS